MRSVFPLWFFAISAASLALVAKYRENGVRIMELSFTSQSDVLPRNSTFDAIVGEPPKTTFSSAHNPTLDASVGLHNDIQAETLNTTMAESQSTVLPSRFSEELQEDKPRRISMVVKLTGELGNNLVYLMHAYATKLSIEEAVQQIEIDLVGEHQNNQKWKNPANGIRRCFPNLKNFQFSSGVWSKEFKDRTRALSSWLKQHNHTVSVLDVDANPKGSITVLKKLLQQQQREPNNLKIQEPPDASISLPYLRAHKMESGGAIVEKYLPQIQRWLSIDEKACCKALPSPNETIFHFRNFAGEGPRLPGLGMVEVGPQHVVPLLRDHVPNANTTTAKVGLITRHYPGKPAEAQNHIHAMQASGDISLRVLPAQTGVKDFCVLLKATHVVGTRTSTFVTMAGILGNQTSVALYMIDTPSTRKNKPGMLNATSKWKGGILKDRFRYVTYPEIYQT